MIDLAPAEFAEVKRILLAHVPGAEVRAFGSRVHGRTKPWSDLDLVILGPAPLSATELGELREAFEESMLPMRVDLVDGHTLGPEFRALISERSECIAKPGDAQSET